MIAGEKLDEKEASEEDKNEKELSINNENIENDEHLQ